MRLQLNPSAPTFQAGRNQSPLQSQSGELGEVSTVVVTMTLARTPAEAALLQRSLSALAQLNLRVFVGDGGSDHEFVRRIAQLPGFEVCPWGSNAKPTLVNQLRLAFARAEETQPDQVIYTEPDKLAFFKRGAGKLLVAGRERGAAWRGLILAGRTPRQFATFPQGQRVAETLMNRLCGEALRRTGDYTYGPMLISGSLAPYLRLIPEKLGWGWRFFLIGVARQLRTEVDLLPVASQCPRAQQDEDDARARDYRLRQLIQNVTGLANGWTCLLDQHAEPLPHMVAAA